MPVHDWARVEPAIFHDFHHEWLSTTRRALNDDLLPPNYYALVERQADGFGADGVTSTITVRHVSGDHIVAVVEILSPGNKASRNSFKALLDKACELIEHKIHLLLIDLFPPTKRDPHGLHAALWEEIADEPFTPPPDKPLTLAAYESALTVKAYIEPVAVGDTLAPMPLFLEPGAHVLVPLEATYAAAFSAVPRRWRRVLEPETE